MLHQLESLAEGPPGAARSALLGLWRGLPLSLKRAAYRTAMYSSYACIQRPPHSIVLILSTGRTGSHLLRSYLNSLPGVGLNNEVLNAATTEGVRGRWISRRAVLRHLRLSVATSGPAVGGCKLIFEQLRDRGLALEDLQRLFPAARWLISYRESLADQYLSQLVAVKTQLWIQRDVNPKQGVRIRLDADRFQQFCAQTRDDLRHVASHEWISRNALAVKYEDLSRGPSALFCKAICPFLGIPTAPVSTDLVKQNERPLEQTIENAEELGDFLEEMKTSESYRLADSFVKPLFVGGALHEPGELRSQEKAQKQFRHSRGAP
jgi:hypothetical protein